MHRVRAGTETSTATGHTGRYLKDADQYTLPQNILYFSVCLIGPGFIVLPYITVVLSLPVLIGCLLLLGLTSCYTHKIIIEMAEDYQMNSLEEIGEKSFGILGYYTTWICAFVFSFTSALVCLSGSTELLGIVIDRNVQFSWSLDTRSISRLLVVLAVATPSLLISVIRVPRKIVVFHFFALCGAVSTGCVLLALLASQIVNKHIPTHLSCWMPPKSIDAEFVEVFMLLAFCFVGQHKSLDAFQHLRLREEPGRWSRVVKRSSLLVFIVYCVPALAAMVCSQSPDDAHSGFCATVKEHFLFELFLAITLALIVPTDVSTMRRLTVRMLNRHSWYCLNRNWSRSEVGGEDSLVVFSTHGVPTLQGLALSGEHFTIGVGDSGSDSSGTSTSGGRGSTESNLTCNILPSPTVSPIKPSLSSPIKRQFVRRVTISEIVSRHSLSDDLLDDNEEESNDSSLHDPQVYQPPSMQHSSSYRGDVSGEAVPEPTVLEVQDDRVGMTGESSSLADTRGIMGSVGGGVAVGSIETGRGVGGDEEIGFDRDSIGSSIRDSSMSSASGVKDTGVGSPSSTGKRNIVAKIRKGVAKKTGAHGFFSRSSSMPTESKLFQAPVPETKHSYDRVAVSEGKQALEGDKVNTETQEVDTQAPSDVNPDLPIDQSSTHSWAQDSLLPPTPDITPQVSLPVAPISALNQSWPNRFRGYSQPEAMVPPSILLTHNGTIQDNDEVAIDSAGRGGRREVGAWAFAPRPNFNEVPDQAQIRGYDRDARGDGLGYSSGEMKMDLDASEWMSVVSDEMEAVQCSLMSPITSLEHLLITLVVWLLVTTSVWMTNFPPAVVLMTYVGGFGASLLAFVLPASFYFRLAPLSSDFSAIARFGHVGNKPLMLLVLACGLSLFLTKSTMVVICSFIDTEWCFDKSDVSLVGHGKCFE